MSNENWDSLSWLLVVSLLAGVLLPSVASQGYDTSDVFALSVSIQDSSSTYKTIPTGFVNSTLVSNYKPVGPHPCDRACKLNSPLICYYQLHLEEYETYNAIACTPRCLASPFSKNCPGCIQTDGVKTPILSINRQLPGPPVNLCVNDLVIVDVINSLTEGTSIHWHGIDQSESPYMDGMPFVTQAEIPPAKIYRYNFVAGNHGTNFYHSHSSWQRGQGIYGSLIVRDAPQVNPHWYIYDVDLTQDVIIISDWGYNKQRVANTYLIHGRGWSSYNNGSYKGAPNVITVRQPFRYRFRLIYNGVNNIPMEFSIEGHDLLLIAADAIEVSPEPVQSFAMHTGERIDFVLHAKQTIGNYWIKVSNPLNRTLSQVAILRYDGAPARDPPLPPDFSQRPPGVQVNTFNVGPGTPGTLTMAELRGLSSPGWPSLPTWKTTYLEIGVNFTTFNFEIDKISMIMPTVPLLLEKDRLGTIPICNRSSLAREGIDCEQTTCRCTHVLQFDLNDYLEIVFFSTSLHPAHLHGYLFYVVGMGVLPQRPTRQMIIEMDLRGELPRNMDRPILKDTVQVPRNGYTIIRFHANNPGFWFLHCHIESHALLGMAAIMQVGQPNQMLSLPNSFRPYPT